MTVRAVTFDVYSAMFDTIGGLTSVLTAFFRGRGAAADAAATARVWRRAQKCEQVRAPDPLNTFYNSPTIWRGSVKAVHQTA